MGKITFYCTICAGPLYGWEQRKRSMVQPGEDADLCFEDDCDCEYDEENHEVEEDENSEADLLKHDEYCTYRRGYWGDILSERDIGWLSEARMLRMRQGGDDSEDTTQLLDDGSTCYLTRSGSYDPYDGLIIPGLDKCLWPNQDGFLVHDACWQILHLVHNSQSQWPLDLRHVYLTMLSKLTHENDTYIYWDDNRLYGGTEEFAEQEWLPVPGYEWLVADPMKEIDFSELIMEELNLARIPDL